MKLADTSIRRPVLATVMVGALMVFGLVAFPNIGVDLFPEVEFPIATITAVYPGADPVTVESKVVDKLEEAVSSVNGIKVLRSTSMENVGQVVIQFVLERSAARAVQDVRDKVSSALRNLPPDLEPPVVEKFDVGAAPILAIAVAGPQPIRELTRITDDVVKQKLQSLRGVGGIDIVGGREREFHVWIDARKLEAQGLSVDDVMGTLRAQNIEIPGGRLNVGDQELVVKTRGQLRSIEQLRRVIITSALGATIRIGDIARVEDGVEEARSYASRDGISAVSLVVRKQSGANTVAVAKAVHQAIAKLNQRMPEGVKITVPLDNSVYIGKAISDVQFDLAFGAVLAVIIILFFLHDWRATAISALAIPTSVVATFAFINAMGFTFNNMTMLALTLSIGILVDDAIVVIEAIHRHVAMGKPAMRAASDACKEIGLAVMATTASIVAVFVPVAVMKGLIGRFFLQFGLTVAFAVIVSLFVAFTLTPMMASRMLRTHHSSQRWLWRKIAAVLDRFDAYYRRILGWALHHRAWTLLIATVAFFGSCSLMKVVPFEFLPPEDRGEFSVKIETTSGTDLPTTRGEVERVGEMLRRVPGVESTFATVGGGAAGTINKADLQVNLVERKRRDFTQAEAMAHVRKVIKRIDPKAQTTVDQINAVGGGGFRAQLIQLNIRGNDFGEINKVAKKIIDHMRRSGGYVDIDSTYRGGKPEVAVVIDRDRAADLGVPVATIAASLRTLVAGEKVGELNTDGDRFDIRVRLAQYFRSDPNLIGTLQVRSISGGLVPLSNLVTVVPGEGPATIERQSRRRQVTVLANLEGKALGEAVQELEAQARKHVPATMDWDWAGMGEVMKESAGHMAVALVLAIIMIYLILAAQFESFVHPFTIMLSLPMSLVGALGALAVTQMSLNIFSMIGVIMLMGLVTKNAILLVDYTIQLRAQGDDCHQALLKAGPVRLRPILMTTAAMIAGMLPVALGQSEGGEQRAPMAICVIGGLITSTLLTLVVVPVVYSLIDGLSRRLRGRSKSVAAEPSEEAL
ncbi:MAG: efflux RND transporter permease subunit [Deltaproteobacteria bacterium]|nr:efflux RND transporter permease subunit [Deltaproteobacteria bacterium]